MGQTTTRINVIGELSVSNILASLNQVKTSMAGLKLPPNLQESFTSAFSKLDKEITNFKSKLGAPIKTPTDVKNLEKNYTSILSLINSLDREFTKLGSKDAFGPLASKISAVRQQLDQLTQAQKTYDAEAKKATKEIQNLGSLDPNSNKKQGYFTGYIQEGKDFEVELTAIENKLRGIQSVGRQKFDSLDSLKESASAARAEMERLEKELLDAIKAANTFKNSSHPTTAEGMNKSELIKADNAAKVADLQKQFDAAKNSALSLEAQVTKVGESLNKLDKTRTILNNLKAAFKDTGASDAVNAISQLEAELNSLSAQNLEQIDKSSEGIARGIGQAKQEMNGLGGELSVLEQAVKDATNFDREIQNIVGRIGYIFSLTNGFEILKKAIRGAFENIQELDKAMTNIAVVTDMQVKDLWAQRDAYAALASEIGGKTVGAFEVAQLYYQQGLNDTEVAAATEETLKFARIANMDYAASTDAMTSAIRGFKLEMEDTKRVNDVYSELAARTASDQQEIAEAVMRTASIAKSAGMELETTSAFLAQMIETTREAPENLGTAMKTIIARFQELKKAPSEIEPIDGEIVDANKVDAALKTIGVSLRDTTGQFRDLDSVFLEIASKWEGLDRNTQRYIATIAAGSRQQSRFIAMMDNYGRTMELVGMAQNSEGAAQEQFLKTLDSLESKLNQLKNAADLFMQGIANSSLIKGVVDGLTAILTTINDVTDSFGDFGGAIARIGLIIGGLQIGKKILAGVLGSVAKAMSASAGAKIGQSFGGGIAGGIETSLSKIKKVFTADFWSSVSSPPKFDFSFFSKDISEIYQMRSALNELNNIKILEGSDESIAAFSAAQSQLTLTSQALGTAMGLNATQTNLFTTALSTGVTVETAYAVATDSVVAAQVAEIQTSLATKEITEEVAEAKIKEIIATQAETAAARQNNAVVATGVLTKARYAVALLFSANAEKRATAAKMLGIQAQTTLNAVTMAFPIGWIIAAVAAVIALGVAYSKYQHAVSAQGRLESLEAASDHFKQQGTLIDENISKIQEFSQGVREAYSEIENLTKGTLEWNKKMTDTNQSILDMAQSFPELYQHIKLGESGLLEIDLTELDKFEEKMVQIQQKNQAQQLFSEIQVTKQKINVDREALLDDLNFAFQSASLGEMHIDPMDQYSETISNQLNNVMPGIIDKYAEAVSKSMVDLSDKSQFEGFLSEFDFGFDTSSIPNFVDAMYEATGSIRDFGEASQQTALQVSAQEKLFGDQIALSLGEDKKGYGNLAASEYSKSMEENRVSDVEQSSGDWKVSNMVTTPEFKAKLEKYVQDINDKAGDEIARVLSNGDVEMKDADGKWEVDKELQKTTVDNAVAQMEAYEQAEARSEEVINKAIAAEQSFITSLDKESESTSIAGIIDRISSNSLTQEDFDILQSASSEQNQALIDAMSEVGVSLDLSGAVSSFADSYKTSVTTLADNMINTLGLAKNSDTERILSNVINSLSKEQMDFMNNIGPTITETLGRESGANFYADMSDIFAGTNEQLKKDAQETFGNIDFSSPIAAMSQLQTAASSTSVEIAKVGQDLLDTGGIFLDSSKQFKQLTENFDEWDKISEKVKKLNKEGKNLDASGVRELSNESELLSTLLDNVGFSAEDAAWAIEGLVNGTITVDGLTDAVIAATKAFDGLNESNQMASDYWSNLDLGLDEGAVGEQVVSLIENAREKFEGGEYGNSQLKNTLISIFGIDQWESALKEADNDLAGAEEILLNRVSSVQGNLYGMWEDLTKQDLTGTPFEEAGLKIEKDGSVYFDTMGKTTEEWVQILADIKGVTLETARAMFSDISNFSPDAAIELAKNDMEAGISTFLGGARTARENTGTGINKETGRERNQYQETKIYSDAEITALADAAKVSEETILSNIAQQLGVEHIPKGIEAITAAIEAKGYKKINLLDTDGAVLQGQELVTALNTQLGGSTGQWIDGFRTKLYDATTGALLAGSSVSIPEMQQQLSTLQPQLSTEEINRQIESIISSSNDEELTFKVGDLEISKDAVNTKGLEQAIADAQKDADSSALANKIGESVATALTESVATGTGEGDTSALGTNVQTSVETGSKTGGDLGLAAVDTSVIGSNVQTSVSTGVTSGLQTAWGNWVPSAKDFTINVKTAQSATGSVVAKQGARAAKGANNKSKGYPTIPEGEVLVGEEAPELIQTPNGYYIAGQQGPEVIYAEKGTTIYNGDDTKDILSGQDHEKRGRFLTGYKKQESQQSNNGSSNGGGGGRGSGGSSGNEKAPKEEKEVEDWKNPYDWLFNLLKKIGKESRKRERLEWEYAKLLEKRTSTIAQLVKKQKGEIDSLKKSEAYNKELISKRKKEAKSVMKKDADLKKYAKIDTKTGKVTINWDKIDKVKDPELGKRIEDYVNRLEFIQDEMEGAEDELRNIQDDLEEVKNRGKEEYISVYNQIYEALVAAEQAKIDQFQKISDSIEDSNNRMLDSLQKSIDNERKARERDRQKSDIEEKQRRLALLKQNTSGANALQIKALEEEIANDQESYTDALIDDKISVLQEQNQAASEQRQQQIEIMQNQLNWNEKNGAFAAETTALLSQAFTANGLTPALEGLLANNAELARMSSVERKQWVDQLSTDIKSAGVYNTNQATDVNNNTPGGTAAAEAAAKKEAEAKDNPEPASSIPKDIKRTLEVGNVGGDVLLLKRALLKLYGAKGATKDIDLNSNKFGTGTEKWLKQFQKDRKVPVTGKLDKATKALFTKKYASGGLADFTGPAWLDGSKSKPEMVLSARDTENFIKLKDVLSSLIKGKGDNSPENSGNTYVEVHIDVESLDSDYGVEQLAKKVTNFINQEARYRNVNVIKPIR